MRKLTAVNWHDRAIYRGAVVVDEGVSGNRVEWVKREQENILEFINFIALFAASY